MDQSVELTTGGRKLAAERLREFVVGAIEAAPAYETPFYHLVLDHVFPDDVYAAILANMPEASDYRPMHGRSKGHDLADGTHTRVKIDLFPEYIRHLPPEKRALWNVVAARCAPAKCVTRSCGGWRPRSSAASEPTTPRPACFRSRCSPAIFRAT